MASLPLLFFFILNNLLFTNANLHKTNQILKSTFLPELTTSSNGASPTTFFEVTKPIELPKTKPCSHHILHHDFGYTYGKPPVLANYTFPSHCSSPHFSKIVLEWKATCKGRQFDRIFGVWLSGVEILRSCTAEPKATGIVWKIEKDVTRYYSLLVNNDTQTLAVYLGNLIDKTYTGIYHVDIILRFYPSDANSNHRRSKLGQTLPGFNSNADLILPISRNLPLNDGLWFRIENSTHAVSKQFEIPRNVYRAVLQVFVSFHENDEFWFGNVPNEYIAANNITNMPGNGPFREVVVSLDGRVVGAIWPFTVVYTGGINPLLWRPVTGIGSFDLPTYDIEITPFLGTILDGKSHRIEFRVTNALNVWFVNANLHVWLDSKSSRVTGKLQDHRSNPLVISSMIEFKGFDGKFLTNVSRSISSSGYVESSYGNITTRFIQDFDYSNSMTMANKGNSQIVNQVIRFDDSVEAKIPSSYVHYMNSSKTFPFYMNSSYTDQGNGTALSVANVTLVYKEKKWVSAGEGISVSTVDNKQDGQGVIGIKNNLVVKGVGSTQQVYKYDDGKDLCYFRNISSSNYTILYDNVGNTCNGETKSRLGFGLPRSPFLARRVSLDHGL